MTLRLVAGIWLATLLIVGGFAFLQINEERERLVNDLQRRSTLLADSLRDSVEPLARRGAAPAIERALKRLARPDRRIAVYDAFGSAVAVSPDREGVALPASVPEVSEAIAGGATKRGFRVHGGRKLYVQAVPLVATDERPVGALVVVLDAAHLDAAESLVWQANAVRFVAIATCLSLITIFVVRASVTRPMSAMADWAKSLKAGRVVPPPDVGDARLFGPLAVEVTGLAKSLYRAQAAAEHEAALRLAGEALWTEARLKQFVRGAFDGRAVFVVSNREPVSHVHRNGAITVQMPASGVVTALEPVMRACGGVWVAHGSGDADRATADARGRIALPPDDPRYTLRRVWLTEDEEQGYYYGLANEGLWPLCHVVHARPTFRPEDWEQYRAVNVKFAEALLEEMEDVEAPLVLVQDYHFALL
ncbi:MAG TPA: trehalose-6-phosphate synthase, partial [Terriglobales bacterium]|nr:trehalose-6-phosphate synthase [Terriglobales bacterium]